MKILEKISIPKDNVNDDAVQIKKIYVKDNEEVQANTLLMDYETSKANYEIESSVSGFIKLLRKEGDLVNIGEDIIIITNKKDLINKQSLEVLSNEIKQSFSKNALKKINELKIDKKVFKGENLITEKKVMDYYNKQTLENNNNLEILPMTSTDQAMLKMVLWQKENTVPAYLEILTDQSHWDTYAQGLMKDQNILINPLLSILAYRLVKIAKNYPEINSYFNGENIIIYKSINLGFTVEVKENLYLVVIRDADKMDELTFIKKLFKLQKKAFNDKLNYDETSEATIAFTSLSKVNVYRHIPILPTHTGLIVAHSSPSEVVVKKNVSKPVVIGATYDHRYLKGGRVAKILNEMVEE